VNSSQRLLEEIESIKNILMARASGERADESKYQRLRNRLTTNALVTDKLPSFVRTCGSLGEFWTHIQDQSRTYAGRRRYIAEQFEEVLTFLEQQATTASDEPISQVLDKVDGPHVAAAWQMALERRASDPAGAITSAETLIETVCRHILDEQKVNYSDTDDLPKLYRLTAESLNLSPSQHTEQVFRQILGGCQSVIEGLGAMQDRHSDTDGKETEGFRPSPRHAELAANLAGTMATFLLATWEAKQK
jgi:predicted RNA-binding Zn ribbon-like protein